MGGPGRDQGNYIIESAPFRERIQDNVRDRDRRLFNFENINDLSMKNYKKNKE